MERTFWDSSPLVSLTLWDTPVLFTPPLPLPQYETKHRTENSKSIQNVPERMLSPVQLSKIVSLVRFHRFAPPISTQFQSFFSQRESAGMAKRTNTHTHTNTNTSTITHTQTHKHEHTHTQRHYIVTHSHTDKYEHVQSHIIRTRAHTHTHMLLPTFCRAGLG